MSTFKYKAKRGYAHKLLKTKNIGNMDMSILYADGKSTGYIIEKRYKAFALKHPNGFMNSFPTKTALLAHVTKLLNL